MICSPALGQLIAMHHVSNLNERVMKRLLKILASGILVLLLNLVTYAEGWRGIIPFHSTRADVEKLLGQPPLPPNDGTRIYTLNKGRSIYFTDEGEVYIVYANNFFGSESINECLKKLPEDAVLFISVEPKNKVELESLNLDLNRFKTFDPSTPKNIGYKAYLDKEAGLLIRTYKGKVDETCYIAASKDNYLCPKYYENPESLVQLIVDYY
jgi:hypothetical protein